MIAFKNCAHLAVICLADGPITAASGSYAVDVPKQQRI